MESPAKEKNRSLGDFGVFNGCSFIIGFSPKIVNSACSYPGGAKRYASIDIGHSPTSFCNAIKLVWGIGSKDERWAVFSGWL